MQAYFFLQLRVNIKPIFACDHLVAMRYTRGMRCGELPEAVRSGFVTQPENQDVSAVFSEPRYQSAKFDWTEGPRSGGAARFTIMVI